MSDYLYIDQSGHKSTTRDHAQVTHTIRNRFGEKADFEPEVVVSYDIVLQRITSNDSADQSPVAYRIIVRRPDTASMRKIDSYKFVPESSQTPFSKEYQLGRLEDMLVEKIPINEYNIILLVGQLYQLIQRDADSDDEFSLL